MIITKMEARSTMAQIHWKFKSTLDCRKKPTFHIAKSAITREARKLLWETDFPVKDGEEIRGCVNLVVVGSSGSRKWTRFSPLTGLQISGGKARDWVSRAVPVDRNDRGK